MTRIAVVGLGAMGMPMATCLAGRGFDVVGFEPFDARAEEARSAGLTVAADVAEALDGAEVVLLAVRDGMQAAEALMPEGSPRESLGSGALVLLTSTVGAPAATSLAESLSPAGVSVVDAPVSGGPVRAGDGDLLIVVGGPPDDVARARPVLDALGSTVSVVGDRVGDGQLLKLVNQLLAGVHIAAAAEAVALATQVGLDPVRVIETLGQGAAASFMLGDRGPRIVEALTGDPEIKSRVEIFVKDMGLVAEVARSSGVATPTATAAGQLYLLAAAAGLGPSDDSTVVRMLLSRKESPR